MPRRTMALILMNFPASPGSSQSQKVGGPNKEHGSYRGPHADSVNGKHGHHLAKSLLVLAINEELERSAVSIESYVRPGVQQDCDEMWHLNPSITPVMIDFTRAMALTCFDLCPALTEQQYSPAFANVITEDRSCEQKE